MPDAREKYFWGVVHPELAYLKSRTEIIAELEPPEGFLWHTKVVKVPVSKHELFEQWVIEEVGCYSCYGGN